MSAKEDNFSNGANRRPTHFLFSKENTITLYTVLKVLVKMRTSLGLEAMICYIGKYLQTVETHNPDMERAVNSALRFIDVKKIYEDAMGR